MRKLSPSRRLNDGKLNERAGGRRSSVEMLASLI
jgi:hypothetical protein